MSERFSFSEWLKRMLTEREMTQVELSERTGITVPTICGYLHDRRWPSLRTAEYMAEVFGKRIQIVDDEGQEDDFAM